MIWTWKCLLFTAEIKHPLFQLNVIFAGVDVPPIEINVKPHVNTAGIRIEGLENGSFSGNKDVMNAQIDGP